MSSHADGVASPLQSLIDRAPMQLIQIQVILLCGLISVIEGVDMSLIPLLAPSITKALSLSPKQFGFVLSALPVGLIIGGALVGYLGDRTGRRLALIIAMLLMTVSTLATALVDTVPALLVFRVLTGVAFGGIVPVVVALVSEFTPMRIRTSMVAMVILGAAAGQLLASLLIKLPMMSEGPWQTMVFYVAAGCGAVTLLLVLFLPESPRYLLLRDANSQPLAKILQRLHIEQMPSVESKSAEGLSRNHFGKLFTQGRALGTCLLWATFIGVCAVVSFFSNSLPTLYAHAGKSGSTAMAFYSSGAIAGGLLLPLFVRLWHANRVLLGAIFVACVVTFCQGLVLPMVDGVNLTLAALCGAFVSGSFFILYPPAVKFYPTAIRSTGIGAAVAFGRFGNVATPAAAGFMLNAGYSAATVFETMAAPLVISFVALTIFHKVTESKNSESVTRITQPDSVTVS
jgi:predicted MFS family arabinose efflux permease